MVWYKIAIAIEKFTTTRLMPIYVDVCRVHTEENMNTDKTKRRNFGFGIKLVCRYFLVKSFGIEERKLGFDMFLKWVLNDESDMLCGIC